MLGSFADDVSRLTGGELTFEWLPSGAIVGNNEMLGAIHGHSDYRACAGLHGPRNCLVVATLSLRKLGFKNDDYLSQKGA